MKSTAHPEVDTVKITPAMAKKWLEMAADNRPVKTSLVARFAREMAAGRWLLTGEAVKFNKVGLLIDGQHRLWACILAKTPFKTLVVRGLSNDVFPALDRGRSRSLGDNLAMMGETHYNQLGAAINLQWQYENRFAFGRKGALMWPEISEAVATLDRNPEIRDGLPIACKLRKLAPGGLVAFLAYQFSRRDRSLAEWFFYRLEDGCNLEPKAPVKVLRERLLRNSLAGPAKLPPKAMAALIIKAWNATVMGREMCYVAWRSHGKSPEPFPTIKPKMLGPARAG